MEKEFMKRPLIVVALLSVVTMMWAGEMPVGYYNDANGKSGDNLKDALHGIIHVHTKLSYGDVWDALSYTDEDSTNTNNVILLYSGWSYPKSNHGGDSDEWNREHTWAKSQGDFGTSAGAGTDIHHLRPTDVTVNSARGNLYFDEGGSTYVDGSRYGGGDGTTACKKTSSTWEPADEVKGDVARMLFYMATCYESEDGVDLELAESSSTSGRHGKLSTLLRWHNEDPVSAWEQRRNNRVYERQGNRNPFIDHPEYVCSIWGGNSCDSSYVNPGDTVVVDPGDTTVVDPEDAGSVITMTTADYQSIVDYVDAQGLPNSSTYDDSEYYYGASAHYTNFDIRDGKCHSSFATPEEAIEEAFIKVILPLKEASAEVGDSFVINYATYDGNDATGAMSFYCSSIDPLTFVAGFFTSNRQISDNKWRSISIYPSPATSSFSLSEDGDEVNVMSLSGQIISTHINVKANTEIDLSSIEAGVYLVQVRTGYQYQVLKLIKK